MGQKIEMLGDRVWHRYSRENLNVSLLVSLVVLFLLYPVMVELGLVRFYRWVFIFELILASFAMASTWAHRNLAVALGAPAILFQMVAYSLPSRLSLGMAALATLVFLVYVIIVVYRLLLAPGVVTGDKLAAAVNVYLLLGLAWAIAYGVIATLDYGAFTTSTIKFETLEEYVELGAEFVFIYFSFVTITTLGYGDVLPVTPIAQTAAWTEAVVGQLFVAVTIARLVGLLGRRDVMGSRKHQDDRD
jgi:hypothetical protein